MDGLLSTILNNLNTGLPNENRLTAALELTELINQGLELQTGRPVQITLNENPGQLTLSLGDGKTISLPASSLRLSGDLPSSSETLTLEARILGLRNGTAQLQLTGVNNRPVPQYLREQAGAAGNAAALSEPVIVRETSELQRIPLAELSLKEVAETSVSRLPLPETAKNEIRSALAQIGLKVKIGTLAPEPAGTIKPETSATVTRIMSQVALTVNHALSAAGQGQPVAEIVDNLVQNLQTLLQETGGNVLPAVTASGMRGETVFASALGTLQPEIALQLPENLPAELEITAVVVHPAAQTAKPASPADTLLTIIKTIQEENPQLFKQIEARLPADNENMLRNLAAFGKAAAKGDVRQWLGADIVKELENGGPQGRAALSELQSVLQESSRQTPSWRIVEIPFYAENRMDKIRLAVKQYPEDEEEEENSRRKFGTRFVVDTDFTRLGAFQFDGFSFAKDRRFDLIIRTERDIGNDLCANIMRIFKTTLNDVGYSGNIKVNLKENFIKISEDNNQNKVLSQDLFI